MTLMRARRTLRFGVGLSAVLLPGALALPSALADEPGPDALPITVVAVQTNEAYDQAEALTKAVRNAVRASRGWSLGEGDFSLEVLTLSLKCPAPPDAACESRIADQIKAERYVWGVVDKKGEEIVGELHLWVRGKGSTQHALRYSANLTEPEDDALRKVALDSINELTGGAPKGSVLVKAGNVAGQVFLDGQPVGALANGQGTFSIGSGPHRVIVKAPGFADIESPVTVRPNTTVELVLNPIPQAPEKPVDWRRIGGFVGVGLGVALTGAGVYSSLQVSSIQNDEKFDAYRAQFTSGVDVCDAAKKPNDFAQAGAGAGSAEVVAMCDDAATFEMMQAVFYGVGAVTGGVGIYLLATSGEDEGTPKTGLSVKPKIGRDSGSMNLQLTF
jgi:hypothetical protein